MKTYIFIYSIYRKRNTLKFNKWAQLQFGIDMKTISNLEIRWRDRLDLNEDEILKLLIFIIIVVHCEIVDLFWEQALATVFQFSPDI